MKIRASGGLMWLGMAVLTLVAVLLPAGALLAQSSDEGPTAGQTMLAGGVLLVFGLIGLAFWVYLSLALQTLCIWVFDSSDHCQEDPYGKCLVGVDSDPACHSNVKHCQEASLVVSSFPGSSGEYCHLDHRLDGNRRGPRQAQLVGHFADRSSGGDHCPGLSRLV